MSRTPTAKSIGRESDLDGNARVIVLLTQHVNDLSADCNTSGSIVLGFFFGLDLGQSRRHRVPCSAQDEPRRAGLDVLRPHWARAKPVSAGSCDRDARPTNTDQSSAAEPRAPR